MVGRRSSQEGKTTWLKKGRKAWKEGGKNSSSSSSGNMTRKDKKKENQKHSSFTGDGWSRPLSLKVGGGALRHYLLQVPPGEELHGELADVRGLLQQALHGELRATTPHHTPEKMARTATKQKRKRKGKRKHARTDRADHVPQLGVCPHVFLVVDAETDLRGGRARGRRARSVRQGKGRGEEKKTRQRA